jgi:hypothetical protein
MPNEIARALERMPEKLIAELIHEIKMKRKKYLE